MKNLLRNTLMVLFFVEIEFIYKVPFNEPSTLKRNNFTETHYMTLFINAVAEDIERNCCMLISHHYEKVSRRDIFNLRPCTNWYLCGKNVSLLLRKWATIYKNLPKLSKIMISDFKRKFEMFDYVMDDQQGKSQSKRGC